MKALALFLMLTSHQYLDGHDIDPRMAATPVPHYVPGFVNVEDEEQGEFTPQPTPVCPTREASQSFWVGMQRLAQVSHDMADAGISKEHIATFTDARVKEGLEILHCHM
jgi:hypothetical protein